MSDLTVSCSSLSAPSSDDACGIASEDAEPLKANDRFFGPTAAAAQASAFDQFSHAAWNSTTALCADRSSGAACDLALLAQPFMCVGLGALGLANDVAVAIKDPSALVAPLLDPAGAAVQVKNGVTAFLSEPNPFRQCQTAFTTLVDPGAAGVHLAGEMGNLTRAAQGAGKALADDAQRVIGKLDANGALSSPSALMPKGVAAGANLLLPDFGAKLYGVPKGLAFDDAKIVEESDLGPPFVGDSGTVKSLYLKDQVLTGMAPTFGANAAVKSEYASLETIDAAHFPVIELTGLVRRHVDLNFPSETLYGIQSKFVPDALSSKFLIDHYAQFGTVTPQMRSVLTDNNRAVVEYIAHRTAVDEWAIGDLQILFSPGSAGIFDSDGLYSASRGRFPFLEGIGSVEAKNQHIFKSLLDIFDAAKPK